MHKPLGVNYLQHKSMSKEEGVRFLSKIILSESIFFCHRLSKKKKKKKKKKLQYAYCNQTFWAETIYARVTGT